MFSLQDTSSKADKGQAKGGKAQQKTNSGGGKGSSPQEKKADVKQAKDPTSTTLVTWAVPSHFQREPKEGEVPSESLGGLHKMDEDVDLDVLAMELVSS